MNNLEQYRKNQEFELCSRAIRRGIEPYFVPLTSIEIRQNLIGLDYFVIRVTMDWMQFPIVPDFNVTSVPGWTNSDWMYYIAEEVIKQFWNMPSDPIPDNIILGSD